MNHRLILAAAALAIATVAHSSPTMTGMAAVAPKGQSVNLQGVGWGQKGRFELPELGAKGVFRRSADSSGRREVDYAGTVDFTLDRGEHSAVTGHCRYRQGTSEFRDRIGRDVRVETTMLDLPFNYTCRFLREGQEIGKLMLDRASGAAIDLRTLRRGEVQVGSARLDLRSVHTFEGSKMPAEMPLGYLMAARDGDVGAAYLNGGTRRLVLPAAGDQREAALLASLALALLWDPGDGD